MANAAYGLFKQKLGEEVINLSSDTIKASLVTSGYTVNLATHDFFDDLTNVVATVTLTGQSWSGAVFDANDLQYTSLTGTAISALILWMDTGSAATSPLICYLDTITGFPLTITSGTLNVIWDNGASKVFRITG